MTVTGDKGDRIASFINDAYDIDVVSIIFVPVAHNFS